MSIEENQRRYKASPRGKYISQKINARQRGIEFKLTFEEWSWIWQQSGKWDERGCKINQYVMCRIGDTGAYEIGNVFIGLFYRNFIDGHKKIIRKHTAKSTSVTWEEYKESRGI